MDNKKHNQTMETLTKNEMSFFNYWYFRYTLVIELYMVEKWEKIFIRILYNNINNNYYY